MIYIEYEDYYRLITAILLDDWYNCTAYTAYYCLLGDCCDE